MRRAFNTLCTIAVLIQLIAVVILIRLGEFQPSDLGLVLLMVVMVAAAQRLAPPA